MDGTLQLRLLGSPKISLADVSVTETLSTKAQAILYYLAVTGQPQPRATLATLLWGDVPENTARTNLRKTLSGLREKVGDYLDLNGQTIAFRPGRPIRIDVADFKARLDKARATGDMQRLQEAVALYRGDLLSGYYVRHAPDFENWMMAEQTRLREMVVEALQSLAAIHAGQRDLPEAMAVIRRLLSLEPWREEAHRQLMLLLARDGQRSAALAQFEICRQMLADELGVEPGPETIALYQRLRDGKLGEERPAAEQGAADSRWQTRAHPEGRPWPVEGLEPGDGLHVAGQDAAVPPAASSPQSPTLRHNLPPQSTHFIGRQRDLADIIRRLIDRDCRLLTIVGQGGMGKTRTALQAAQTIVDSDAEANLFTHGVFFVPLAAVTSTSGLIAAIAETVNFTFYSDISPQQQLLDHLRDKEMLLLLDNFEHLLGSVSLISDILLAAPGVKMLVTSREALNLQEAWFHPLTGLSFPTALGEGPDDKLESYDAVRLFVQNAQRARVQFSLAAEQAHVVRICQLVEGMPLGIELAAAWLKVLPAEKVAAEIERNLDILSTRLQNVPERHRSMRAVFEHSWQRLAEEEREVLKRLSVFRGGFQQEAAEQVAGTSLLTLTTLVEKSLVQVTKLGRYQMHELLRQFAAEKLAQTPAEAEATFDALCRYYADFLCRHEHQLEIEAGTARLAELTPEADNIRVGWDRAVSAGWSVAIPLMMQYVRAIRLFYSACGWYQEGIALFDRAINRLETAGSNDVRQRVLYGRLLLQQAMFYQYLGRFTQAEALCLRSLDALQDTGAGYDRAATLRRLGALNYINEKYDLAQAYLAQSLALLDLAKKPISYAKTQLFLGIVAHELKQYQQAKQLLDESLAILGSFGELRYRHFGLGYLAGTMHALGHPAEAKRLMWECLTQKELIGDPRTIPHMLYHLRGNFDLMDRALALEARRYLQTVVATCRDNADDWGVALSLSQLGYTYCQLGEYDQAEVCFRQALQAATKLPTLPMVLEAVVGQTFLRAKRSPPSAENQQRAVTRLALVMNHPETTRPTYDRAAALLAGLEKSGLPPEVATAAQAKVPALTLEALVEEILA